MKKNILIYSMLVLVCNEVSANNAFSRKKHRHKKIYCHVLHKRNAWHRDADIINIWPK